MASMIPSGTAEPDSVRSDAVRRERVEKMFFAMRLALRANPYQNVKR